MKYLSIFFVGVMLSACGQKEKQEQKNIDPQEKQVEKKDSSTVIKKPTKRVEQLDNGKYYEYYPNNTVHIDGQLDENNRKTGVWKSFRVDGQLWSETSFQNGKKNGPTVSYHKNGEIYYRGEFTDDKKSGKWIFYDQNGVEIKTKEF